MHQELQDQDLQGFPHLEERWIGKYVDQDHLSLSLKYEQEPWEGLRGRASYAKSNNGGERRKNKLGKLGSLWGRRPLKRAAGICPLGPKIARTGLEAGLGWAGGREPHRAGRPYSRPRLG